MSLSLIRTIVAGIIAAGLVYLYSIGKLNWQQLALGLGLTIVPSPIRLDAGSASTTPALQKVIIRQKPTEPDTLPELPVDEESKP